MIEEIQRHFEAEYPREACGVIGVVKGKKRYYPCENVAEDDNDFIMSSTDYMKHKRSMDIIGIVHNHPDADNRASEGDIDNCNALGIPYYIFSYPDMELNILEPEVNVNPLLGREYKFELQTVSKPQEIGLQQKEYIFLLETLLKMIGGLKI